MFVHMLVLGLRFDDGGNRPLRQTPGRRHAKPIKMVVLGDSLSAGLGLPASAGVPGAACKRP